MKRVFYLFLLLILAVAAIALPAYAASGTVETVSVSFGQAEIPSGGTAWGAVYDANDAMLHVAKVSADQSGEVCLSVPAKHYADIETAKLIVLKGNTLIPLQDVVISNATNIIVKAPAPSSASVIATVVTGINYTEATTTTELKSAISDTGNSVVTLQKDIGSAETPAGTITLPYSCTVDFNGKTIIATTTSGNGSIISAAGTKNSVTTLKNGRLVSYEVGVKVNAGDLVVDNMTIDLYTGCCIGLYNATGNHTIRNSRLSSGKYSGVSFNSSTLDYSSTTVTIENSSLVSYRSDSTTSIFTNKGTASGKVVLGENVELYTFSTAYAQTGIPVSCASLTQKANLATVTVMGGTSVTGLNHWSTDPTVTADNVVATVANDNLIVETTSPYLTDAVSKISSTGDSVVTLYQDVDTTPLRTEDSSTLGAANITLPYSCTVDFNGHTVTTADESGNFAPEDHGIIISKAGTNQTTTLKNGQLISYEVGVKVQEGNLVIDNMTLDNYYGGCICVEDPTAEGHVIKDSRLSSRYWVCFSYNITGKDFSSVGLTVENSSLTACKLTDHANASPVFTTKGIPGTVTLGKDVDILSYGDAFSSSYTSDDGQLYDIPFEGETLSLCGETAIAESAGTAYADLNRWATARDTSVLATVVTGSKTVTVTTLDELLGAIDASGNSVVTLHKELDTTALTTSTITLPYPCTIDLNGNIIRAANGSTPSGTVGIIIEKTGTTTLKNGHLIAYEVGINVNAGTIKLDNMIIDTYSGACVAINTTGAYNHEITRTQLSSGAWGCLSFNRSNLDFSSATVTIEESVLVARKKAGAAVFVTKGTPGTIHFGENVDLYTFGSSAFEEEYNTFAGTTPTKQTQTSAVMAAGVICTGMNHWSNAGHSYLVGFGRTDISPDADRSVPMAGYGSTSSRMSEGFYTINEREAKLQTTAVAVTDRFGESALFLTLDLIKPYYSFTNELRQEIWEATGIDPNRIMITYTHTHSGPDLSNWEATDSGWTLTQDELDAIYGTTEEADGTIVSNKKKSHASAGGYRAEYIEYILSQTAAAAKAAWNDRQGAEMSSGSIEAPDLSFVRHYERTDGTYFGPGFGTSTSDASKINQSNGYSGHSKDPDPELRLLRFTRSDGEDVLMMNWQAHATMNSHNITVANGKNKLSSDFVEGIRYYVENTLGMNFAYFQGGAGDHMPTTQNPSENNITDIDVYGQKIGAYIETCLNNKMQKIAPGPIRSDAFIFQGEVNHANDSLYEGALLVNASTLTGTELNYYRNSLGFINSHHVKAVIRCFKLGEYIEERCSVLSIGAVGFAAMPHELFGDTGIAIRDDSPFVTTFILAYSNDHNGYLPTSDAYLLPGLLKTSASSTTTVPGSYEVGCTNFASGVAEKMAATFAEQWGNILP